MGMPTLRKFLCCIQLDTGGLIIGWFMTAVSVIAVGNLIWAILAAAAVYDNAPLGPNHGLYQAVFLTIVIILSIYIVYFVVVLFGSVMLIVGTSKRQHTKLMPFMVIMCIGMFVSFVQVFFGLFFLLIAFFMISIQMYFFICTFSLYDLLKNEAHNRRFNQTQTVIYATQTQQPSAFAPYQAPQGYQVQHPPQIYVQPAPQVYVQPATAPDIPASPETNSTAYPTYSNGNENGGLPNKY